MKRTFDEIPKHKTIHFIGIGGVGMSGLARILLAQGYRVSGTDMKETIQTIRLQDLGATLFYGHDAANLRLADIVVVSSAIDLKNPELAYAIAERIPVIKRGELLGIIMQSFGIRIAVCGTHGKTTTSAMAARVLDICGKMPTFVIGADVHDYGINAVLGESDFFVAESDESDGSFLYQEPSIGIFTNLEQEHMEHYGSLENLKDHFLRFMEGIVSRDGMLVINADDPLLAELGQHFPSTSIQWYGCKETLSCRATDIEHTPDGVRFRVHLDQEDKGSVELKLMGTHQVYNSLAVIAMGHRLQLSLESIKKGLLLFSGTKRRCQLVGQIGDIAIYDDYAHHPTEIRVTLEAIKLSMKRRLICVFQPHRYSRTKDLLAQFPNAFGAADITLITEIYSVNETKIRGLSGKLIAEKMKENGVKDVLFVPKKSELARKIIPLLLPGDLVVMMGAGDISSVGKELLAQLRQKSSEQETSHSH
jgi:UDP-N-acetylmuramate--alanine ligase